MSHREPLPLLAELVDEVRAFERAVHKMDEAAQARLGINQSDGRCLDILQQREPMTAGDLAIESGLTTGAVTTLLDRLERAGYVRRARDTVDRRRVLVELTPVARERIAELYGPLGDEGRKWFSRYTDDEVRVVIDFLRHGKVINERQAARIAGTPALASRAAGTRSGSRPATPRLSGE